MNILFSFIAMNGFLEEIEQEDRNVEVNLIEFLETPTEYYLRYKELI
jgi:hypothetical protein